MLSYPRVACISMVVIILCTDAGVFSRSVTNTVADDIHAIIEEELVACNLDKKFAFGVAVIGKNVFGNGKTRDVTFTGGYGYRELEKRSLADEDSIFCIGSISKHMTATLIVHLLDLLQEKGHRYTLQTLVTELDHSLDFPGSSFHGITLEDILIHRTGILDFSGPAIFGYSRNTTKKHIAWVAANAPRASPNRTSWIYNNHVFGTAGYLAEILAEKLLGRFVSWEELMDLYFFEPMGIHEDVDIAGLNFTAFARLAYPYLTQQGRYRAVDPDVVELIGPLGPAGAVCMSPKAMAVWMQFILNGGYHNFVQLVSQKSLEDTWKSRMYESPNPPTKPLLNLGNRTFTFAEYQQELSDNSGYGLGWSESRHRGYRYVQHTGGYLSYGSICSIFPELNIGILTSSSGPYLPVVQDMMFRLHYRLFDYLMQLAPLVPSDNLCHQHNFTTLLQKDLPAQNESAGILIDPKFYVGEYYHPVHGIVRIEYGDPLTLFLGRDSNATIQCLLSARECSLRFNGKMWWLSDSDAYNETRDIRFGFMDTGFVSTVTLPIYMEALPPVFEKVSAGARSASKSVLHDIDVIIKEEMSACHLDRKFGYGVAVIAKNYIGKGIRRDVTFTSGYGYRDLDKKTYADANTMFCIGSISKHITATLLVHLLDLLQERGHRYNLQTLVTELDKDLNFPGSQFIGITLEDVLSHRTGIADYLAPILLGTPRNTTRKHAAWAAANAPRVFPNRQRYMYNNHVFGAAGYFAEVLARKLLGRSVTWEELLDMYFFEPLGIHRDVDFAGYNFTSFSRLSFPHLSENLRYRAMDARTVDLIEPTGPSGSVCMTPNAMAVWMQFMLERGQHRFRQLISSKTLEDTWKTRIMGLPEPPHPPATNLGNRTFTLAEYQQEMLENLGYGLGWMETRHRGHRLVQHSGGYLSYMSLYSIFPDQDISIFTTSAGPYIGITSEMNTRLHYRLFDYFMQLAPLNPADSVCAQVFNSSIPKAPSVSNPATVVTVDNKYYIGEYYHPVHGILKIEDGSPMKAFMGREGNATIECTTSVSQCLLRFHGITWWVSGSDGYGTPDLLGIGFNFAPDGFVNQVTVPMYCLADPPLFERVSKNRT
ncbi:uncharacterized protein LOC129585372 isoform X2 [Paramacrobiotus metropolitanus]|uniref:uncharacterized protein LOC129585372 isoform X2 n=1 Tax=Paramacrobiotus metropolitanus TaxID=2943436 RepID=UPI002445E51F|nr:uncharacterized protein LOC129585372 isoform X2 [Paramacrobiotus metropolitanus]